MSNTAALFVSKELKKPLFSSDLSSLPYHKIRKIRKTGGNLDPSFLIIACVRGKLIMTFLRNVQLCIEHFWSHIVG